MPRSLATSGTVEPEAILPSACRSFRMIYSGECLFPIESPPFAHSGLLDSHRNWIRSWALPRLRCSKTPSGGSQDALTQQLKARPSVHLALDELQPVNLPLYLPAASF